MTATARIQKDFSRAANYYHTHATLQREVTQLALTWFAPHITHTTPVILDIGCGTGFFAKTVHTAFPAWHILQADYAQGMCHKAAEQHYPVICSDMTQLAIKDHCLDGFFSCLSLQWVDDPYLAFIEAARTLKPHAIACFVTFGTQTLHELKTSFSTQGIPAPVLEFPSSDMLTGKLQRAGFELLRKHQKLMIQTHETPFALMRHLKHIGADFKHHGKGLSGKQAFMRAVSYYNTHFANAHTQHIHASYEINGFIVKNIMRT